LKSPQLLSNEIDQTAGHKGFRQERHARQSILASANRGNNDNVRFRSLLLNDECEINTVKLTWHLNIRADNFYAPV